MIRKVECIENVSPTTPSRKSVLIPAIGIVVCAAALFWAYNHISGGCTGITDVFTYCQIHTK